MERLEAIVNKLEIVKNKEINPKYDSKTFTSANKYIEELGQVDIRTKEGLESYRELTGYSTKDVAPEKTASNREIAHTGVSEIFGQYATKNIGPVIGELEDMAQLEIGYTFGPKAESKDKKYDAVRKTVYEARETVKEIKEKPGEYISKQIKDAPDFIKAIIARFSDEVLDTDARDAQRRALGAIHEYGSAKFVTDTHEHLTSLQKSYIKDMTALGNKEMEMKKKNPYLDTDKSVKYFAEIEKERVEIEKRKEQFEDLSKLTGTIVQEAIMTIQEKEKAEAEKNKVIQFPTREKEVEEEEYRKAA